MNLTVTPANVLVLSVFTLDDAVLARARYWAAVPSANDLPPLLTGQSPANHRPCHRRCARGSAAGGPAP